MTEILKKKYKAGGESRRQLADIKTFYKFIVIRTVSCSYNDRKWTK